MIFGELAPSGVRPPAALLFGFSTALAQRLPAYSESAGVPLRSAPVRPDADRGRRRDRPLDSARIGWSSLSEAVTAARRAPAAPGHPSSQVCSPCGGAACGHRSRPAGRVSTSSSHAAAAIPVALLLGALAVSLSRRARSRLGPTLGRPRGAQDRPPGVACWGSSACSLALTAAGSRRDLRAALGRRR